MSWGGSVSAMISSLRNNRLLLRRKKVFTILKEELEKKAGREPLKGKSLHSSIHKPLSDEVRAEIKAASLARIKKERWISAIVVFSLFICFGAIYFWMKPDKEKTYENMSVEERLDYQKKQEQFMFYINDGYMRLRKGEYNNAIFQFDLATKEKPNNLDAQLGLTEALLGKCITENQDCERADSALYMFNMNYGVDDQTMAKLSNYLLNLGDTNRVNWLNQ